jgi:hypothetical protein
MDNLRLTCPSEILQGLDGSLIGHAFSVHPAPYGHQNEVSVASHRTGSTVPKFGGKTNEALVAFLPQGYDLTYFI